MAATRSRSREPRLGAASHAGDGAPLHGVAGACPRCGAEYETDQEYCLECGLRLPTEPALFSLRARTPRRRAAARRADWLWLVAILLGVAAAGAAVAIFVSGERGAQPTTLVATEAVASVPRGELGGDIPAGGERAARPSRRAGAGRAARRLTAWPRGRSGYTVVLASTPSSVGRGPATKLARRASAAGLAEVGVIVSSEYASLHPGYYVVFSGIHDTPRDAEAGVRVARERGYRKAYTRQLTS